MKRLIITDTETFIAAIKDDISRNNKKGAKMFIRLISVISFLLVLAGCASRETSAPGTQITSPVLSTPSLSTEIKPSWEKEWEKLVLSAKKEGKVVIISSAGGELSNAIFSAFRNKTQIAAEIISIPGAAGASRIVAEQRSGLYLFDVSLGGSTTTLTILKPAGALVPLEPVLMLPELTDPELIKKVWWNGKLRWLDKEKTDLAFLAALPPPVIINAELVKNDDIKSYKDLLAPRWKGKIVFHDPSRPGFGARMIAVLGEIMGWDYVRQLVPQVATNPDSRLIAEWVARGKYPIAMAVETPTVIDVQRAGAPIQFVMPVEGSYITSSAGGMALLKNAPHPNAAKLFVNWLLTKEGQTVYSRAYGQASARLDARTEGIIPESIPKPGVNYLIGDTEDFVLKQNQQNEKVKEILAELLK